MNSDRTARITGHTAARPRSFLRGILVNAGLVVLSLFLAIAGVGVVLRLIDGVPVFEFKNYARDYIDRFNRDRSSLYDERLGWQPKPNLHSVWHINGVDKFVTTDARGFRIRSGADAAAATEDIIAVGDSFTFGSDVGDDETWPAYLEEMGSRPIGNAASTGWGTDQIVMRAEDLIELVHPRTLIVGVYPPDIQRSEMEIQFGAHKPYYSIEQGELVLNGVPVPHLATSVHDLGWERSILGYSYVAFWIARRLERWSMFNHTKQAIAPGTGEEISCLLLKRLQQRARVERIRLILAMIYGNFDFVRAQPAPARRLLRCAQEAGYETVDTWDLFANIFAADKVAFDSLYVFPDRWSHTSGAGNKIIATAIAQRLNGAIEQSNAGLTAH